jgi:hypothetical protein
MQNKMGTQQEIWKPVADSNGIYYISSHGRVKSYKYGKERILKPGLVGVPGNQYLAVVLTIKSNKKTIKIHRLVALAFIENIENKSTVNHIDTNKLNNHIDNLEWNTSKENINHAWQNGLCESSRLANSKPVIDISNGKKYRSLKLACEDTNQSYTCHKQRHHKKREIQRFFYLNDNGNG